jgi:hypothetical protein
MRSPKEKHEPHAPHIEVSDPGEAMNKMTELGRRLMAVPKTKAMQHEKPKKSSRKS